MRTIFCPNVGAVDLQRLFTRPDDWATERALVDGVQFYSHHVRVTNEMASQHPREARLVGPNTYESMRNARAFATAADWSQEVWMEHGVVKPWDPDGAIELRQVHRMLRRVGQGGGRVDWIAMDEPLFGGVQGAVADFPAPHPPEHAHLAFLATARFVRSVRDAHPGVRLELVEAYPGHPMDRIAAEVDALVRLEGAPPDAMTIDYDPHGRRDQGLSRGRVMDDLRALRAQCAAAGIAFGMIVTDTRPESLQDFAADSRASAREMPSLLGAWPDHVKVQSWAEDPDGRRGWPSVFEPDDPLSHLSILRDVVATLTPAAT